MKKLLFFLLNYSLTITAQNISIYPYLQNATSTSITIMWECENCNSSFLEWGEYPSLGTIVYPSTEIISSSIVFTSGSTKFGDSFLDKFCFFEIISNFSFYINQPNLLMQMNYH